MLASRIKRASVRLTPAQVIAMMSAAYMLSVLLTAWIIYE